MDTSSRNTLYLSSLKAPFERTYRDPCYGDTQRPGLRIMDLISKERRSELMRRVRSKDTVPEMIVRKLAHSLGARYRLHYKELAGKPDLVFIRKRKVIFVHGCYWHRHPGCKNASFPLTHQEFWEKKFRRNVERDAAAIETLQASGWKVLVIWECETRNSCWLKHTLVSFLEEEHAPECCIAHS